MWKNWYFCVCLLIIFFYFFFLRSGLTLESIFQNWLDTSGIPKVNTKYQFSVLSGDLHFSLPYTLFKSLPELITSMVLNKQF